jgi:hypothetical protein
MSSGYFFRFFASEARNWVECDDKRPFSMFWYKAFLWKCQKHHFRNVTRPRGGEHCQGIPVILNIKVEIRKYKSHQRISWVWFAGNDIINYNLILNTNCARDRNIQYVFLNLRNENYHLDNYGRLKIVTRWILFWKRSYIRCQRLGNIINLVTNFYWP